MSKKDKTLICKNTGTKVQIFLSNNSEKYIIINGERGLPNAQVFSFIRKLIENFPAVVSYGNIYSGTGDVAAVAHKLKREATQFFDKYRVNNFVKNISGEGYTVSESWDLLDNNKNFSIDDRIIVILREMVKDSIEFSKKSKIHKDTSGLMYIQPTLAESYAFFHKVYDLYWDLMQECAGIGREAKILRLREILSKMVTYFLFWRVGDNLTDNKWRKDYEEELDILMEDFENAYIRINES